MKVLGSLCLIDQGELDWKILAINADEAKERRIKNLEDFNRLCPGAIKEIQEWFRIYKTYEGKGENKFGHGGRLLSVDETIEIIHENHQFYRDLLDKKVEYDRDELWLPDNKY